MVALALLVSFLFQGTWALAGTTGSLNGTVTNDAGAPIAGASVKVSSASQTASTTTDSSGHFVFISLAPDTYTVTVEKTNFAPANLAGVTVFADQSQSLAFKLSKSLQTIAKVTARAAGSLVKSGTTSDVYSVNAATAHAVQGLGGGYNLDSAYSAIYSQPGVTSQIGNSGVGQVFYIRGSAYSQVGYEYDGVPVNRAFDNYNANSLSSLGAQETEVYTGGSPAGGASSTLAGYLNQVIKTGTYPGYGTLTGGIGGPSFYHKLSVEAGGASPDRMFSYYVGLQGSNANVPAYNNQQGGNFPNDGSGSNGIFGSLFNPEATLFAPFYNNGPFPTCTSTGAPTGSPTYGGIPACSYYSPNFANNLGLASTLRDRENVMNFHVAIPHKHDSGRDDLQLLFYNFAYQSLYNDGINAMGGPAYWNSALSGWGGPNGYAVGNQFIANGYVGENGPYSNFCAFQAVAGRSCATTGPSPISYADTQIFAPGTAFGQSASTASVVPYYVPGQTTNRPLHSGIDPNYSDALWNDGSIVKLQYQKNFGSNALLRVLGYTFYSDWLQTSPNGAAAYGLTALGAPGVGNGYPSPDYELSTHSRGFQLDFEDQINAQNLISLTGNYTTATVARWNNSFYGAPAGVTNLSDGTNCYNSKGNIASCLSGATQGTYASPVGFPVVGNAAAANAKWIVTRPGAYGSYNNVQPRFSSIALQDQWQPTDRLNFNLGVRYENYSYVLGNTNSPEFSFWFKQAANAYCYDPGTGQPMLLELSPSTPPSAQGPVTAFNSLPGENPGMCYSQNLANGTFTPLIAPSGKQALHPNGMNGSLLYTNVGPGTLTHSLFSPRIAGTYTINADNVLRFSYGRYSQPTETAFEQYSNASGLGAAKFDFTHFWGLGFHTPAHDNPVQTSNNFDFSLEHHFKNTDTTLKLSPFYRYTTNQLVTVSLGGNFASGVNAGTQKSSGIELAIQKGDPSRNGLSGQLSYTYTDARLKFNSLANGTNAIDVINSYIQGFNGLTSAGGGSPYYCAGNPTGPNGSNAPSSTATCAAGTPIQNPYYGMKPGSLLDRNAYYPVYANNPPYTAPDNVGSTAISPNAFTGFLNWKHNRFTATASFQLNQGTLYGSPLTVVGLDPRTCAGNEAGSQPSLAGSKYGLLPDYQTCQSSLATPGGDLAVPNPQTGSFDGLATYRNPWQFNLGMQFGYDVNPRIHATLTLANVVNRCFGGTKTPWQQAYKPNSYVCGYAPDGGNYVGAVPGEGFFYGASPSASQNGTAGYPAIFNQSYATSINAVPFQAYLQVNVKL